MPKLLSIQSSALLFVIALLAACGGGGGGSDSNGPTLNIPPQTPAPSPTIEPTPVPTVEPTPAPTPTPISTPGPSQVSISGTVTYDFVPYDTFNFNGLNYDAITAEPLRGVTVEAVDGLNTVLATTQTSETGEYSLVVEQNTPVLIRVKAELLNTGALPNWEFRVGDNTNGNALYTMQGSLTSSGTENSIRNLNAPSGWTGSGYGEPRVAGPFAILDSIYIALQRVLEVAPDIDFPEADIRWSVLNRAATGANDLKNEEEGLIGTSFFRRTSNPLTREIFILGDENNDTDEYDRSIVLHEFTHYFEDAISRSDSIGGSHTLTQSLDMRLVFSEGLANALSGIYWDFPLYIDTVLTQQSTSFGFSLESADTPVATRGWFNEGSTTRLVFDLFDSNIDEQDTVALGFEPLFNAFVSDNYINQSGFASIYSFSDELIVQNPSFTSQIRTLLENEQIFGTGEFGEGETNDGGVSFSLPVYHTLQVGGSVTVCSDNQIQERNALDVHRFVNLSIPASGNYSLFFEESSVTTGLRDPVLSIFFEGALLGFFDPDGAPTGNIDRSFLENGQPFEFFLTAGDYVIEVSDEGNTDEDDNTGGLACFDITVN